MSRLTPGQYGKQGGVDTAFLKDIQTVRHLPFSSCPVTGDRDGAGAVCCWNGLGYFTNNKSDPYAGLHRHH